MLGMMKWTVAIAALASLPMLAAAQPAAPSLPSADPQGGLQARLEEIIKLQRAPLQASVPDDTRACIYLGGVYSEGAVVKLDATSVLTCKREQAPQYGAAPLGRLAWVRGQ